MNATLYRFGDRSFRKRVAYMLVSTLFGAVFGLCCALLFQSENKVAYSALFQITLLLRSRSFLCCAALNVLFPCVLYLLTLSDVHRFAVPAAFGVHSFFAVYFISLFSDEPQLFFCAVFAVLPHCLLLLPLQYLTCVQLMRRPVEGDTDHEPHLVLWIANATLTLLCVLAEFKLAPLIMNVFLQRDF